MKNIEKIKKEFEGFTVGEKIFFPLVIVTIIISSIVMKDNKVALLSAVCGVSYTILAGKGRVSCYYIGLIGSFCYSYIAFFNQLYGQLFLYMLYYVPMQVIGIFKWRKHLKGDSREIEKAKLTKKQVITYLFSAVILTLILYIILKLAADFKPFADAFTVVFSVLGLFLTVKRCIEQWYVWFFVNFISLIMWVSAYLNGSNCFATVLMWLTYTILSVYFLIKWRKELTEK